MAVYDRIGTTYARYRRADPRISARIDRALGEARSVIDVGAGAGSYEAGDHTYVAVEPSAVMVAQRPPGAAPAVRAVAERLPFADGSFDAALASLTVHHWSDLAGGLAEMRRVSRGPVVVFTWASDRFSRFWLVDEYLPEAGTHDRTLAGLADVCELLPGCAVEVVPVPHDCTDGFFAAYWRRPERYLDPDARAAISGIALLPPAAVRRMATALAADLESGAWARRHGDLLGLDEMDLGYRLVVTGPDLRT